MSFTLLALTLVLTAAPTPPLELMKREGQLVIDDGASFFVFEPDGAFHSFPHGISGRVMKGTWTKTQGEPLVVDVVAQQTWVNGGSANDDYRKLVFAIYQGTSRPTTEAEKQGAPIVITRVFQGYWLLQELTKTTKPKR